MHLKERFRGRPLVEIVRKLIVKVDDPARGPEAHKLLVLLFGEKDMPAKAGSWMDWLDSMPEADMTWEKLESQAGPLPQQEVRPEQLGQPAKKAPKRALVNKDEGGPAQPFTLNQMVLTEKQQLWQKALARHRSGKKGRRWNLLYWVMAALAILLAYRTSEKWLEPASMFFSRLRAPKAVIGPAFSPVTVWGQYDDSPLKGSAWDGKLHASTADRGFLASVDREGMPEGIKTWLAKAGKDGYVHDEDWEKNACFVNLWKYESLFAEIRDAPCELLIFEGMKPMERVWKWKRTAKDGGEIAEGDCEEKTRLGDRVLHLNIIRQEGVPDKGGAGAAHYIILDAYGLRSWQWKLKLGNHLLSGKVSRALDRKSVSVVTEGFPCGPMNSRMPVAPSAVIMPLVWSPVLAELSEGMVILPLSGKLAPAPIFFQLESMKEKNDSFSFSSSDGSWQEKWQEQAP